MEHVLDSISKLDTVFRHRYKDEAKEVELSEELRYKIRRAIVEIRMAADNLVGGLEAMLAEIQLQLEYVDRLHTVRQATRLRYGNQPKMTIPPWPTQGESEGIDFAGIKPHGSKFKVPPLTRQMGHNEWAADITIDESPDGIKDKKRAKKQ